MSDHSTCVSIDTFHAALETADLQVQAYREALAELVAAIAALDPDVRDEQQWERFTAAGARACALLDDTTTREGT